MQAPTSSPSTIQKKLIFAIDCYDLDVVKKRDNIKGKSNQYLEGWNGQREGRRAESEQPRMEGGRDRG
jgi:hypothetical protein